MTDAPVRKITGLAPRREGAAPLARLVKAERDRNPSAPPPVAPDPLGDVVARPPDSVPADALPVSRPATRIAPAGAEEAKETVTLRFPVSLRQRSRAAFLATRSIENDETYSDMVAKAVDTELRRREALYNAGQPFAGGKAQLPPGRPFVG